MKFAVLTDLHIVPREKRLYGLSPAQRLDLALASVAQIEKLAFLVITGDLAHNGDVASYELLRRSLGRLDLPPSILLLGNHDSRSAFRSVFPDAPMDAGGFVQGIHEGDEASIVTLDTLDEQARDGSGELCASRLSFLEQALADANPSKPVLLFLHHPPMPVGLPSMDAIALRSPAALRGVLNRTRKPDVIFCGHVHRPVAGIWNGIPFQIQRSLSHQVALDQVTASHTPGSHEAPDFTIAEVVSGEIVLHQRSFMYDGPLFSLHDPKAAVAEWL